MNKERVFEKVPDVFLIFVNESADTEKAKYYKIKYKDEITVEQIKGIGKLRKGCKY